MCHNTPNCPPLCKYKKRGIQGTGNPTYSKTDRQTDRPIGRQIDRQNNRQTGRQTDTQKDRVVERKTDRRTQRYTYRRKDRKERKKDRHSFIHSYTLFKHGKNISYKINIKNKTDLHVCCVRVRGEQLAIDLISKISKRSNGSDVRWKVEGYSTNVPLCSRNYVSKNRYGA